MPVADSAGSAKGKGKGGLRGLVAASVAAATKEVAAQAQEAGKRPDPADLRDAIIDRVTRAMEAAMASMKAASSSGEPGTSDLGPLAREVLTVASEADRWRGLGSESDGGSARPGSSPSYPFSNDLVVCVARAHAGQPDQLCGSLLEVARECRRVKDQYMCVCDRGQNVVDMLQDRAVSSHRAICMSSVYLCMDSER